MRIEGSENVLLAKEMALEMRSGFPKKIFASRLKKADSSFAISDASSFSLISSGSPKETSASLS